LWNDPKEREHIRKLMALLQEICPGWKSVGMILNYFEFYKRIKEDVKELNKTLREYEKEKTYLCYG
jgi:hypothetical protein